jgi:hypothetical protein
MSLIRINAKQKLLHCFPYGDAKIANNYTTIDFENEKIFINFAEFGINIKSRSLNMQLIKYKKHLHKYVYKADIEHAYYSINITLKVILLKMPDDSMLVDIVDEEILNISLRVNYITD